VLDESAEQPAVDGADRKIAIQYDLSLQHRRWHFAPTLEHDPEKWQPVFGKRSCSNKELERDDDSKKNHPALGDSVP
jgi:hypothetical protein